MRLRLISEIQRKSPTTNMDRTNVTGVYAVASINDYLHMVHDGDGHALAVDSNTDNKSQSSKVLKPDADSNPDTVDDRGD